jgi:hypothetical protein
MNRLRFAELEIAWDASTLALDPFGPVLPLVLEQAPSAAADTAPPEPDLAIIATRAAEPVPSPATHGATPVLFHGKTQCFHHQGRLSLWDGASLLEISSDGRRIDAWVHDSSLERVFHFSSVSVMMALLLALRHRGMFHLHAAAARWPDGETWLIPGESSSGKSTLALALFDTGAAWLSDDALLLRPARGSLDVVGWARMIRMTQQTALAFPALTSELTRCPPGSARDFEVDPRRVFAGRGITSAGGPFTLIFPRIGDGADTSAIELSAADAFGRTLHACAWVASDLVPRRAEQLETLARLVDTARSFEVRVGSRILNDPAATAAEIRALLSQR